MTELVKLECTQCGAPMPNQRECEYCGSKFYTGPDIPEQHLVPARFEGWYNTSTCMIFPTSSDVYYGSGNTIPYNPNFP